MQLPDGLAFSPWMTWQHFRDTRLADPRFRQVGVYLLAHFRRRPRGPGYPERKEVIYVGETTKQSLLERLDQFGKSAFQEKSAHSGGWTYRALFDDGNPPAGEWLYLSILPVPSEKSGHHVFLIKYLERAALWSRIEAIGVPPVCNKT